MSEKISNGAYSIGISRKIKWMNKMNKRMYFADGSYLTTYKQGGTIHLIECNKKGLIKWKRSFSEKGWIAFCNMLEGIKQ